MIYKKTIPGIRERKVLIRSKSSCWQTLILWTFCTWTKAPTSLNYMVWAGACFQDLPNHTTAIYFPKCSCQNFPDPCSVLHLQGHLVNVWQCQAAFHTMLLKLLSVSVLHMEILWIYIYFLKKSHEQEAKWRGKTITNTKHHNISVCFEANALLWQWTTNILSSVWWVCFYLMDSAPCNSLDSLLIILLGKWVPNLQPSVCNDRTKDLTANFWFFFKRTLPLNLSDFKIILIFLHLNFLVVLFLKISY